jgi:hypothetical protein
VLEAVERAKEAAVSAVPDRRGRARPLAVALFEFEQHAREAQALLEGWAEDEGRRPECASGLAASLHRAEELRLTAPELDYEGLVATLAELIDPLDVFRDAAEALRRR